VVPTIRCNIDPETLWTETKPKKAFGLKPIHFFRELSADGKDPDSGNHDHPHDTGEKGNTGSNHVDASNYVTFSFHGPDTFDETCFRQFVEALPWELFRMKGSARFQDRTVFINFVGGKGEWTHWEGDQETRLAFIGWNIEGEDILLKLRGCIRPS